MSAAAHPQARTWRTAILLMICFVLAQADKQVIGLLAVPVQQSLGLSDTELGFLQGGAFAIAFAIGGLPIAQLLDRGNRIRIASACVAAWSIATVLCGLATSYLSLLFFRAATAFAEAGLPPAAFSIFSQSGNTRTSARLTGTFMLAPFIGGGAVMLLGGLLLHLAVSGQLSVAGITEGWRIVFILVGVPGLFLALALLMLGHEPERPAETRKGTAHQPIVRPGYRAVLRTIFVANPFLRYYYLGLMFFYLFAAALIGWFPAFLIREFSLTAPSAGYYAGITYLVCGVAGTLAVTAGSTLNKLIGVAGILRIFQMALLLLVPVTIALPLSAALWQSLLLYGLYSGLSASILALMAVPIQQSLSNDMQARGVALFSLIVSAMAGSAGPFLVGVLNDLADFQLGTSLAAVGCISSALALLFVSVARQTNVVMEADG